MILHEPDKETLGALLSQCQRDYGKQRDRIKELEECGEHRQDIIEILEGRVEELAEENQRLRLDSIQLDNARENVSDLEKENQRLREENAELCGYDSLEDMQRALLGGGE